VNIAIAVPRQDRGGKGVENWKEPFKKLKLSKIRADDEWNILLQVHEKEAKKIHKLTVDRYKVETVMEEIGEGQKFLDQETWKDKFGPSVVEGEGA
jgi:hypothetical protein